MNSDGIAHDSAGKIRNLGINGYNNFFKNTKSIFLAKMGSGGIWSLRRNPQIRVDFLTEYIQIKITNYTKI
jgi:hypothetical protein